MKSWWRYNEKLYGRSNCRVSVFTGGYSYIKVAHHPYLQDKDGSTESRLGPEAVRGAYCAYCGEKNLEMMFCPHRGRKA